MNDALSLKVTGRYRSANFKIFLALGTQTKVSWQGAECNISGVGKYEGPIFSRLQTKVHKSLGQYKAPLQFAKPFSDCLHCVLLRRHSPLSIDLVEKTTKSRNFGTPLFQGGVSQNFIAVCRAIYPVHHSPPSTSVNRSVSTRPGVSCS